MSQINATLRQLQQGDAQSAGRLETFVQPVQLQRRSLGRRLLQGSALIGFLAGFWLHQWASAPLAQTPAGENVMAPAQAREPLPAPQMAAADADQALAADAATGPGPDVRPQAAGPQPVVTAEASAAGLKALKLSLLHKNAELALQKDRLTTPAGDNAVDYYRAMQVLEPDNLDARAGLARVASRYQTLAARKQHEGNTEAANAMLEIARSLVPGSVISLYPSSVPAAQQTVAPVTETRAGAKDLPPQADRSTAASVSASAQSLAQQQLERARQLMARGDAVAAIALLQDGLRASASEAQVELLHQAYLANQQPEQAVQLRQQYAALLADFRQARLQANEWIRTGDYARAIALLEQQLPDYKTDSDYYGLLAGLYYRANRYSDASQAYSRLLALDGDNGNYWLGYAVALDAQSNAKALSAFQRARQLLPEQDNARAYIDSRIQSLTGAKP